MWKNQISVVVPVYNVEPYIRCCVDSILSQSFSDFELILVDDGSTDNSGIICDEYALIDSRICVIHQKNAGQGRARNAGTALATGKYIIYLDSDDYWIPNTLKTLYSEAERNQTQVLMFGAKLFWDGIDKPKDDVCDKLSHNVQIGVVKTGPDMLKVLMDNSEYYSGPFGKFYRLDYLKTKNIYFDEGIINEDVTFSFLSCLYADRVECLGELFYRYRIRPGSTMTSRSFQKKACGYNVCLLKLLELWFSDTLSEWQAFLLERYCVSLVQVICWFYDTTQKPFNLEAARCVRKEVHPAMKLARKLPSLPFHLLVATYNMDLHSLFANAYWGIRRLVEGQK